MQGRLIVVEGLDGSGLHEVARFVFELLSERYHIKKRWLTKEPSEGPIGSVLRLYVDGRLEIAKDSLPLFFAADRADHLFRPAGITEKLKNGEVIVCDRFYLSSYAYQTVGFETYSDFNARLEWLRSINEKWKVIPDLTLFIDQPVEACIRRLLDEQRDLGLLSTPKLDLDDPATWDLARERLANIRQNYLAAIRVLRDAAGPPQNIQIVGSGEAELTSEEIRQLVRGELDRLLKSRSSPS